MASADEFFHQLNLSKSCKVQKLRHGERKTQAGHKNPMTRYAHQALINSRKRRIHSVDQGEQNQNSDKEGVTPQKQKSTKLSDVALQKKVLSLDIDERLKANKSVESDAQKSTSYQCEYCLFDTTTKSEYENHIQSIKHLVRVEVEKGSDHEVLKLEKEWKANFQLPYKCSISSCNAQFIDWRSTLRHIRDHANSFPFSCTKCDSKFRDRSDLAKHIKRHLGVKKFKCELCEKQSDKKYSLELHMIKAHGHKDTRTKNFKCTECGDAFFSKKGVDRHMSSHTGHRPEVCETCGASFHTLYDLKDHMRIHSGEKPFFCDVCDFSTRTAQLLSRHKKKHQDDLPYSCKDCDFSCNNSRSLKRHSFVHSGKKRYKCPYCEHRCNDLENLKKHIKKNKRHKGFNIYPCTRCNFFTDNGNEYLVHMKQYHFPHLDVKSTTAAKLSGILIEESPVEESEDDLTNLQSNSIFENESILCDTDVPPDSIGLSMHPTQSTLPELGLDALSDLRKLDSNLMGAVNRYDKGDFLLSSAASHETQVPQRPATFSAPFDDVRPYNDNGHDASSVSQRGLLQHHPESVETATTQAASSSAIDMNQGYVAVLMKWPSNQKVEVQQGPAEGVTPLTLIVNSNPVFLRTTESKTAGDKTKGGGNSSTTYIMSPNGLVLAENERSSGTQPSEEASLD